MYRIFQCHLIVALLASLLVSAAAHAVQLVEVDVAPFVQGGQIKVNSFRDATAEFVDTSGNARVFAYDLTGEGIPSGPALGLDDPGFNTEEFETEFGDLTGFLPGSFIGVSVQAPLKHWDGTGGANFQTVGNGESFQLDNFGVNRQVGATFDSTDFYVFEVEGAPDVGAFHGHLVSIMEDTSLASTGIYMIEAIVINGDLTNAANGTGTRNSVLSPSESIFLLYNFGLTETDFENSVDAFALSLAGTPPGGTDVPEPASALLVVAGAALMGRRRRDCKGC